ncbi:MAG: tetratricopeptide repeat protein, partial [Fibrobacter sp.]|nr:tetratricopeptide repeat protein [Fibrobacter sp.]
LDDGLKFGDDLKLNDDLMLDDEPSLALNDELNIEGNEPLVTEDVVEKVKSVDVPTDPVITSPMDFVLDDLPEVKEQSSDFAKEMGGAFASMFGSDDDLSDVGLEKIEKFETPLSANPEELQSDLDKNFDSLFGKDDAEEPAVENPVPLSAPDLNSLESEVSSAFKDLFNMEENDEPMPSNSGVDFLMSGDSDDEISAALIKNPEAPLEKNLNDIDESLNTRTLAEIYYDQGLYGKALDIYTDLLQKEPENEEILKRFEEVEQMYRNKFGGKA